MFKTNRIAYVVAGVLCSFVAAMVLRARGHSYDSAEGQKLGRHPPVEELADELKEAWSGHHTR